MEMVFDVKKILIPYDATPSSEKVIKKLKPFLEKNHCEIILLSCIRDRATFGFFQTKSDKKEIEVEKKKAQKYHNQIAEKLKETEISVKSIVVKSDLESKTIVEYAKKEEADIIIMSKSKLGTNAEKVYYNSTVDAVFKKTPIPFLYIP